MNALPQVTQLQNLLGTPPSVASWNLGRSIYLLLVPVVSGTESGTWKLGKGKVGYCLKIHSPRRGSIVLRLAHLLYMQKVLGLYLSGATVYGLP